MDESTMSKNSNTLNCDFSKLNNFISSIRFGNIDKREKFLNIYFNTQYRDIDFKKMAKYLNKIGFGDNMNEKTTQGFYLFLIEIRDNVNFAAFIYLCLRSSFPEYTVIKNEKMPFPRNFSEASNKDKEFDKFVTDSIIDMITFIKTPLLENETTSSLSGMTGGVPTLHEKFLKIGSYIGMLSTTVLIVLRLSFLDMNMKNTINTIEKTTEKYSGVINTLRNCQTNAPNTFEMDSYTKNAQIKSILKMFNAEKFSDSLENMANTYNCIINNSPEVDKMRNDYFRGFSVVDSFEEPVVFDKSNPTQLTIMPPKLKIIQPISTGKIMDISDEELNKNSLTVAVPQLQSQLTTEIEKFIKNDELALIPSMTYISEAIVRKDGIKFTGELEKYIISNMHTSDKISDAGVESMLREFILVSEKNAKKENILKKVEYIEKNIYGSIIDFIGKENIVGCVSSVGFYGAMSVLTSYDPVSEFIYKFKVIASRYKAEIQKKGIDFSQYATEVFGEVENTYRLVKGFYTDLMYSLIYIFFYILHVIKFFELDKWLFSKLFPIRNNNKTNEIENGSTNGPENQIVSYTAPGGRRSRRKSRKGRKSRKNKVRRSRKNFIKHRKKL